MTKLADGWQLPEFFVVRTPYLPVDALLQLGEGLESSFAGEDLRGALDRDRHRTRQRLLELSERAEVREALHLGSPAFLESVDKWRTNPASRRGERVECRLLSYLSRMAGRCTPFGLFAGWSTGEVGPSTAVKLAPHRDYRRRTTLDGGCLGARVSALEADPQIREQLRYKPNSTLYDTGEGIRYIHSGPSRLALVGVEPEPVLRAVLRHAASSATRAELVAVVRGVAPDVVYEEAGEFVDEVIATHLLVSELQPAVTGSDGFTQLIDQLAELGHADIVDQLDTVRRLMRALDAEPPGVAVGRYEEIRDGLRYLGASVDPSRVVRCGMTKPAIATISSDVVAEIRSGVELLARIGGCGGRDPLSGFRAAFQRRYGDREVELCDALDPDHGIGFPDADQTLPASGVAAAPLIDGLRFPSQRATPEFFGRREELLSRWLFQASRDGADEIALGRPEVDALAETQPGCTQLPDAFGVLATVLAPNSQAVAKGEYRVHLAGASGPSGAALLGRFCTGDEELTSRVQAYLRAEEVLRPDVVFAEVVHLPRPRLANVMARPVLRRWEIPYLGRSGATPENQIPVTDLLVSVQGEVVVLRSRRLGCEVVPRLSAAHNFTAPHSVPLYRFLCTLQGQGAATWLSFSFGPLASAPFLPRVSAGRMILSRARWNLSADELAPLRESDSVSRFKAMRALRQKRRIPRWVAIADRDKILPVDLDNVIFVDIVADRARRGSRISLVEQFLGRDELLASAPEGRFVHELVVPFVRTGGQPRTAGRRAVARSADAAPVSRRLPPGSEWLYAKLYTGAAGADVVLRSVVRPLVADAIAAGAADRWFFVRYAHPDWHLRLRVHGEPARLLGEVLPELVDRCRPLIEKGQIWRTELDTYEREVARYGGGDGVLLAERVSYHDSEAVLRIVEGLETNESVDARWCSALVGSDRLLQDFGMTLAARHAIAHAARARFLTKLRADAALRRQLGDRYRDHRRLIERVLSGSETFDAKPFAERSAGLAAIPGQLHRAVPAGRVQDWAASLVHMHLNRMLGWSIQRQELVIYDFLTRHYHSQLVRSTPEPSPVV